MTVSFVLRVTTAAAGDIAGRVEVVETGEVVLIQDAEQLIAFLRRVCTGAGGTGEGPA